MLLHLHSIEIRTRFVSRTSRPPSRIKMFYERKRGGMIDRNKALANSRLKAADAKCLSTRAVNIYFQIKILMFSII